MWPRQKIWQCVATLSILTPLHRLTSLSDSGTVLQHRCEPAVTVGKAYSHFSLTSINFFNYIDTPPSHHRNGLSSAHRPSLTSRPELLCRQQQLAAAGAIWMQVLLNLPCFQTIHSQHINIFSIKYLQAHHGNGRNSAHRLSLASRLTLPCSQQQLAAACQFLRWKLINLHCFLLIYKQLINFFQLNTYRPTMGTAETQPTDWVWCPARHCWDANNN